MKIFTNDEIREIDRYTIETEGVPSLELIERVASGIASDIIENWIPEKPVVVFAGPGNNGADALSVARILTEHGFRPSVFLFNIGGDRLSEDCRKCRDRLLEIPDVDLTEIVSNFSLPDLQKHHLVIDGLFGSGLRDPLSGGFVTLVRYINESRATVLSIDVPSGLFGDWNGSNISRNVIHADVTYAIQFPRISFFLSDNQKLIGRWKLIDIGLSRKAIASTMPSFYLVEDEDVRRKLKPRNPFCSKADLGSAAIVAGSYGMMGAAVLAARSALRAGAGKVTVISPRCGFSVLQTAVPEAIMQFDKNDQVTTRISLNHDYTAVALGPGIGTHELTVTAIDDFLVSAKKPVIIDADALNCIAGNPAMLNNLPVLSIITPHAGEFDRLFGVQPSAEARLRKAIEMAHLYNIFIILKGHYTAIVRPDGRVYFNSSGTPAMATAGAGDCLTGIIASFLAQGYLPEIASLMGVFVHGRAGELAEEEQGLYGVTAGDIAANVGKAIKSIMNS